MGIGAGDEQREQKQGDSDLHNLLSPLEEILGGSISV
jgi:hypothetical protein